MQRSLASAVLVRQRYPERSVGVGLLTHLALGRRHLLHLLILAMAFAGAAAAVLG